MKMTINQIAELAHVSRSVVSRVLNNRPNVSAEARERVRRIVKEYNYTPNPSARRLASKESYEILLLVPRPEGRVVANGYWHVLFAGITEACNEAGYNVTLTMISQQMVSDCEKSNCSRHFDGYILCGNEVATAALPMLREGRESAVLIGGTYPLPGASYVDVGNVDAGVQAVTHLVSLGHRRIAAILGPPKSQAVRWRLAGYIRGLRSFRLPVRNEFKVEGDFSEQSGYCAMRRLLQLVTPPTAVFCMSDAMALGAISAAGTEGLSVPEDLSVVGVDDLPFARFLNPPLTTIRLPVYDLGRTAGRSLIQQIKGKRSGPVCERLGVELVVRQSTAAAA